MTKTVFMGVMFMAAVAVILTGLAAAVIVALPRAPARTSPSVEAAIPPLSSSIKVELVIPAPLKVEAAQPTLTANERLFTDFMAMQIGRRAPMMKLPEPVPAPKPAPKPEPERSYHHRHHAEFDGGDIVHYKGGCPPSVCSKEYRP